MENSHWARPCLIPKLHHLCTVQMLLRAKSGVTLMPMYWQSCMLHEALKPKSLPSCEAQSCVLFVNHTLVVCPRPLPSRNASCFIHSHDTTAMIPRHSSKRTEVHPFDKKYTRINMKDLTEREVVIAVIALSSKLRLLSHHQYKTIGHLMIFLIHTTFTFILIYSHNYYIAQTTKHPTSIPPD